MPINDFLPFATDVGADVMTQSAYAALAARGSGFATGTARSEQVNKVWRQASLITEMITQFIVDQTGEDAIDDGTIATLEANFVAAVQAALAVDLSLYAHIASPAFTGTPTAPTPSTADNSTRLATTALIKTLLTVYATLASPAFSGTPSTPTPPGGDNGLTIPNTAWVRQVVFLYATLASPSFTGTPTCPTPPSGDNTNNVANTFWVNRDFYSRTLCDALFASLGFVNSTFAPLASPNLSGVPTTPTPALGNRTTQIATAAMFASEFVGSIASNGYQFLPSGLLIQWGITSAIPANTGMSFTYPMTFPSGPFAHVASYTNGVSVTQATDGNPFNVYKNTGSDPRFSIFNGGAGNAQFGWIAIGV